MRADARNTFVTNLLKKPKAVRLKEFRAFTVKHPLLSIAYEELLCAILDSTPESIIFIYGPPGAGKSTLLGRLEKRINEMLGTELEKDYGRLPVVKTQLTAPTSGNFDWRDYFRCVLLEMDEPLVDRKLDMERWESPHKQGNTSSNMQLIYKDKVATRLMRFAYEQALKHRRPLAVLVDDAQHLGIIRSGRKLLDQLNTVKSLTSKSKVTHVLCGTYELIPLRNLSGQLSRRSINIHFGRYQADNEAQRKEFINVLYTFQQNLPLAEAPNLVDKWDYFYERSIGCVGVLKDWLTRALALALDSNSSTLSLKFVERRALSISQCTTMMREVLEGEKELEERDEARRLLRKGLGLCDEQQQFISASKDSPNMDTTRATRGGRRVGSRSPVRDKTGVKV